jgi:hypothetical protein
MEPEGSLPHSQDPATCPYPEHNCVVQSIRPNPRLCEIFRNIISFSCGELLSRHPPSKLEDHLLSTVRYCLFNIFAAVFHIWRPFLQPQTEDAPCCGNRYRGDLRFQISLCWFLIEGIIICAWIWTSYEDAYVLRDGVRSRVPNIISAYT